MSKLFYWMWGHVFYKGMILSPIIFSKFVQKRERWVRKSFVVGFPGSLERGAPVCWISKFRTHHETIHLSYSWVSQHDKQTLVNYTLKNRFIKCLQSLTSTNAFLFLILFEVFWRIFQYLLKELIFGIDYWLVHYLCNLCLIWIQTISIGESC